MKKIKTAFTIAETTIALSIIAVLSILTINSAFNSSEAQEKKMLAYTKKFYNDITTIYTNILVRHARSYDVTKLDYIEGLSESEHLREYFSRYLEGQDIDCKNLKVTDEDVQQTFINEDLRCISGRQDMTMGFYLNPECSSEFQIKEYYVKGNNNLRYVDNVCGYMIYSTNLSKNLKGIWGKDVFVIAFGRKGIK